MKQIILSLGVFIIVACSASAGNDKPITTSQLPTAAKQFIGTYFSGAKVSYIKMETELFDKSYEIVFTDGNKVEFDGKGHWKDVDCKFSQVPEGVTPQKIKDYISVNYKNVKITEVDRDKRNYEVQLNNGLELKFDSKFNLIEIDN